MYKGIYCDLGVQNDVFDFRAEGKIKTSSGKFPSSNRVYAVKDNTPHVLTITNIFNTQM